MKKIIRIDDIGEVYISPSGKYIIHLEANGYYFSIYESMTGKIRNRIYCDGIYNVVFSLNEERIYFNMCHNICRLFYLEIEKGIINPYCITGRVTSCTGSLSKIIPGNFNSNYILVSYTSNRSKELVTSVIKTDLAGRNIQSVISGFKYSGGNELRAYDNVIYLGEETIPEEDYLSVISYCIDGKLFEKNVGLPIKRYGSTFDHAVYNYSFHKNKDMFIVREFTNILDENSFVVRKEDFIQIYAERELVNEFKVEINSKDTTPYIDFFGENHYCIINESKMSFSSINNVEASITFNLPIINNRSEVISLSDIYPLMFAIEKNKGCTNLIIYDYQNILTDYPFKKYEPIKPLVFKLIEGMDTSSLPDCLEYGLKAIDINVMKHRQLDDEHYIVIDKHDTYYLVIVESNIIKEVHLIKEVTLKDVYNQAIITRKAIKGIKQVISEGDIEDKALNRVYHMVLMKYEYAQPNSIQYKRETAYLNEIMRQIAIDLEALKDQTIHYIGVQYSNEEGYYDSSIMLGFDDSSEMPAGMKYGREFIMGEYLEGKEKKLVEDYSKMIEKKKKYEDYRELMSTKLYTLLKAKYPDKSIEIFELSD